LTALTVAANESGVHSQFTGRRIVAGLLVSALFLGCSDEHACFGGSKDKSYKVSIVEPWNETSAFPGGPPMPFPCPTGFDLPEGSSFVVKVDGIAEYHHGCSCGYGSVAAGPSGWSWSGRGSAGICSDAFFSGDGFAATNDACSGSVLLRIEATDVPTGKEVSGVAPVAHLDRRFTPALNADGGLLNPDCPVQPSTCRDLFVVEIEEN
jgi:hypothetical protein